MHVFKDTSGREWKVEATFGSYARVKAATGVKLFDIATENRESLVQLADPFTLGAVIWSMIEPQAEARGIAPEEFYEAINGETLTAAYAALIDEMIFFCHPRQRKVLEVAVRKIREVETAADKAMDGTLVDVEKEIDRAISQWIHGQSGTSLPGFSESTRATGPFESLSTPPVDDAGKIGTTPAQSSPS